MSATPVDSDAEAIVFTYRNHRGEVAQRRVRPLEIRFGTTEWHPEPQWLLRAFDLDKQVWRDFAMTDIQGIARRGVAAQDEPVAWRWRVQNKNGSWSHWCATTSKDDLGSPTAEVQPLYAAPPAPSAGARVTAAALSAACEALKDRGIQFSVGDVRAALEAAARVREAKP